MSTEYVETFYGLVMPWGYDDDNRERFMLLVDGEEEFLIEMGKEGNKLADYVDRWVTVDATVREFEDYACINVLRYDVDDEGMDFDDDHW